MVRQADFHLCCFAGAWQHDLPPRQLQVKPLCLTATVDLDPRGQALRVSIRRHPVCPHFQLLGRGVWQMKRRTSERRKPWDLGGGTLEVLLAVGIDEPHIRCRRLAGGNDSER